jgi:predicted metal-dependent hydrolase
MMDDRLDRGIRLFNNREFFECHEVLEQAWTPERGPRRLFLQGLIHLAVGFYHWERNNPAGAIRQLRKGLRKLAPYLPFREGIDTERLHREAARFLEQIEAGAAVSGYPQIHTHTSLDAGS